MSGITREEVINSMQEAAERMGLDLEDLQEMIVEVLEDCSGKAVLLKNAIESKDFGSVKTIAHDIKGSTANYGLKTASSIALQIEQNNEASSNNEAQSLIDELAALSKLDLEN